MWGSRYFSLCSLVVSLFLQHGPTAAAEGCPNKSDKWKDLGGDFCYIIEKDDKVIWTDAVYNCYRDGGALASFHSGEEVKRILNYLKYEVGRLHIGLWKHSDGSFEWVDKSDFDFRNWDRREPSYREEQCVEIHTENGNWNDLNCGGSLGYICASRKGQSPRESSKVCPGTSTKWNDFGGEFCYIIDAVNATTWYDALSICSEEGGSLASFHSIEEVSVLLQHTKDYYERMHIGLLQNADGKFEWADKSPFDFNYWDFGEPNDVDEQCGEMYPQSGQWNDIPCDKSVGYICSTPKVDAGTSSVELSTNLPSPGICGGDIIADSGTINSPHHPENYHPNENCVWKITVPENYQILLNFQTIKVEYGADCKFDYIKIIDGHETESPLLRKICGSQMPQTVLSSGNKISVKFVSDRVHEDTGFTADFTKVEQCGGNIVSEQGVIQTRNYPGNYWPYDKCTWKIRVPDNDKVLLRFQSFELEGSSSCAYDYVEILDGHDSTSRYLGRFCGSDIPSDIIASGHKMTVIFASDFLNEYPGFTAEFSKADVANITRPLPSPPAVGYTEEPGSGESCGEDIFSERGVIVSPNYPNDYPSYERCTWRITVPDNYQVILRFKAFSLERESDCDYDYVEVRDGHDYSSRVLGKFCGSHTPDDVISSGNKMTVKFKSDSSSQYRGFAAVFNKGLADYVYPTADNEPEEESLCSESITSEEGVIQSPNYPENYGPSERCAWKITVPEGHQVSLKFLSFNVEMHDECYYDYVEIRDGHSPRSRVIDRLCGYDIPQQDIRSSSNKLTVAFNSDSSSEYSGFSAEFKQVLIPVLTSNITGPETGICGEHFLSGSGALYSPNYPEKYLPFAECTWSITAAEGQQVVLMFQSFELEYGNDCEFDFVKVVDGHESDSPVLGTFCGESNPGVIRSSGNKMVVKFVTDDSFESSGFFANFTEAEICEKDIIAEEGIIQTRNYPDNYGPGEQCIWHITVPDNNRVYLNFLTFEVDYSSGCTEDNVAVFDGYNITEYPSWGLFCGNDVPHSVLSTGNQITVMFRSDASEERKGFSAEFKKDSCGGDIFADSGYISSLNFPNEYRSNDFCTWNITVPENHEVVLRFESFSLESSDGCGYDYVQINDGHDYDSPVLGKYCGRSLPHEIQSSTEKMAVTFKSDGSVQYGGFKAKFEKGICGEDIVSDTGYISSPNYPGFYGKNKSCVWNIIVPENHQVVLEFAQLDMELSYECQKDFVEILDGHEPGSPSLGKICGRAMPGEIRSSTEKMSIRFVSDGSYEGHGFTAQFRKELPPEVEIASILRELPAVFMKQRERMPKRKDILVKSKLRKMQEILNSMRMK